MSRRDHITVLGAGSWGTALAVQFARSGTPVVLWGRDTAALEDMQLHRVNRQYLPDAAFPDSLCAEPDWDTALGKATIVLICVPSHAFRGVLQRLGPKKIKLVWATKGLELSTGLLPHQVVMQTCPEIAHYAVLSGPTFAIEVGKGLPTAITAAASSEDYAQQLAALLSAGNFRAYTATDIVGVEIGGAVKNALAIAAGFSDGLGYGANARVALITRGLREMSRLGIAMGAQAETFMGLAGLGDLVLTCTDNQSRNRRMGLALAAGKSIQQAEQEIQQVVEGVPAARAVFAQAQRLNVDMPIVERVHCVLAEGLDPRAAVETLLARAPLSELD